AHARAVMDRKPQGVVCKLVVDTQLLDKAGKPEHDEHREGKATLRGDDQDVESTSVVRDGKPMSDADIADERAKVQKDKRKSKKKGGDDDFTPSPLDAKNAPDEAFELVGKETLWGRPVYVVKVRAQKKSPQHANGTLWIDADRFVELKGELTPSEMPPHADWIKVQEQYVLGPNEVPLPAYLHIEGAGHMMFMHKQFRTTLRWSDCR
ncbi:MAG: hypothetical protein LC659_08280, partial [Myxococcales bacterium]|nr:hypothetical protein [Myxococcales bacterium]